MLFNIMIYTLKQFNTSKVHNKLILVTLLIVSTPFLILSKLAQNNFIITQDTNLTELMLVSMALPYQYYLPITAAFFYILNDIFWGLDEKHIYFFNSRKRWIINKVISSIFISFTYVTIVYIFISLIFYFKLKLAINTDFIIYSIISIILGSLVYIIYSLFCILVYLLFRNKKSIYISIVYISILSLIVAGTFSDVWHLPNNLILYNFANINNLMIINKDFISAMFLLTTILFILTECICKVVKYKNLHD